MKNEKRIEAEEFNIKIYFC